MTNENRQLSIDELASVSGGAGLDGIHYLISVTQMKADNANQDAMAGALAGVLASASGGAKGGRKIG